MTTWQDEIAEEIAYELFKKWDAILLSAMTPFERFATKILPYGISRFLFGYSMRMENHTVQIYKHGRLIYPKSNPSK